MCDTIGVMCRGELVAVRPRDEWDEHSLLTAALGRDTAEPLSKRINSLSTLRHSSFFILILTSQIPPSPPFALF